MNIWLQYEEIHVEKLADIINKYNNTYHRTNKMKLINTKSSRYIDSNKKNNKEDSLKFDEVDDCVTILKYKIFFAKSYLPSWQKCQNDKSFGD